MLPQMSLAEIPVALLEQCRDGERAAMEQLLRQISPDVYRIVFSMLRDHDDTDEVVQEALIRLFRHLGQLKDLSRFASWMIRIAVNQVQTFRMRKGRQRLYHLEEAIEPEPGSVVIVNRHHGANPRELAQRRETRQTIDNAISELPDRQQTAFLLFEFEDYPIKQIAEAMGCSEGAVKFNIHAARKKLQGMLSDLLGGSQEADGRSRALSDA
jgi:RNA polymerase sigma-70 factor, ECF subfamily